MNYEYIEQLLISTKEGDKISQKKLIDEFTPFIKKLSRKVFLHNYTVEDIEQECYLSLLKCIKLYNTDKHRFVAYATNGIKNNINYLLRKNLISRTVNSDEALTFTGCLDELPIASKDVIEADLMFKDKRKICFDAINTLTKDEKELILFVNLKKRSLKSYAALKKIPYSTASKRKIKIQKLLKEYIRNFE